MEKVFLLRYDVERDNRRVMKGFFEKVVEVHREEKIPATFFCTGRSMDKRKKDYSWFIEQVRDDSLFDIQNHSYSHIGIGYTNGKTIEALKADFEKSIQSQLSVGGKQPIATSICGVGPVYGRRLTGFDETEKGRQELDMLASLGFTMINSFLTGVDESKEFCNYTSLGHPEIMGFPSGFSDTQWLQNVPYEEALSYILGIIEIQAEHNEHMPLMMHDWVVWTRTPEKNLDVIIKTAKKARECGFNLLTHTRCYEKKELWT